MSISESQKKANQKWDKNHMTTIGCRVTKTKAELFKRSCQILGTIPNKVIMQTVDTTIQKAQEIESQGKS